MAACCTRASVPVTPGVRRTDISFLAIVDNNGVPRWVRKPNVRARNFRRYPDGRYSYSEQDADGNAQAVILGADFDPIVVTVTVRSPARQSENLR